ncbi:hypothetical protein CEV32_1752 [Brucella rhizosphaerae]|uniref:Uncharacterized protein n=1 Tax=Brucella rhizosphaerae TaxID=571254 RepID=A0A256F3G5_9HYPH|nr:hypothetical protein CEV32_1752 [Brucella rhizosphaerae]
MVQSADQIGVLNLLFIADLIVPRFTTVGLCSDKNARIKIRAFLFNC